MSLQTNVERFPVRPAEEARRAPAERRRRSEEKISIGVTEQGNGSDGHERSYVLKAPLNGKIPCSNPRCTHGGFELQPIIDEMRTEGERRQLRMETCSGRALLSSAEMTLVKCHNLFRVEIAITE